MGWYSPLFDEYKARRQENCGEGIEGGVEGREIAYAHPPEARKVASLSKRRHVCQM